MLMAPTTLRLDIYHKGQRTVETLKQLKLAKPSNILDRQQNKQRMQQASFLLNEEKASLARIQIEQL
jgi:hypothetical protein